ncbi:MAG: hypothetical protein ABGW69_03845 [Nanoarchaeota archaeon]
MLNKLSKILYSKKLKEKATQFLAASMLFTGAYGQLNANPIKEITKDVPQVQQVGIKKENYSGLSSQQQIKVNNGNVLKKLASDVEVVNIPKTTKGNQGEVYSSLSKGSNPIQDIYNSVQKSVQTENNKTFVQQQKKIESSSHEEVKLNYDLYFYEATLGDKFVGVLGKGDNIKLGSYYTSAFGKTKTITASYSLGMEEIDSNVIKLDRIKVNVYGAKWLDKNNNKKIDENDLIAIDLNKDGKFEKNEYFKVNEESSLFGLVKHPYIEINGKKVKLEDKIASNYKRILVSDEEGRLVAYKGNKNGLDKILSADMNNINLIAQEGKPGWEVFKTDEYGKVKSLNFSQWDYGSEKDKEEINNLVNGNTYDVGKLAFWHPNEIVGIEVNKAKTIDVPEEIYKFIEDNTNIVFQYFANLEKETKKLEEKLKVMNNYRTKKPFAETGSYLAGNLVGSLTTTGAATVNPAVALVTAGKFIVNSYQTAVKNNMTKGAFTSYDEFMNINSMNEKQLKEYYNNELIAKAALAAGAGILAGVATSSGSNGSYSTSNTNTIPAPNPTPNPVTPYTP